MSCKGDEYYNTVLRDCRHCSLVCDAQYSPSENNAECLSNCPGYMKTGAHVVPALGPLAYSLIALAVIGVIVVIVAIMVIIFRYHKRQRYRHERLKDQSAATTRQVDQEDVERHNTVVAIRETQAPDPLACPGIHLNGFNNRALSTATSETVR